MKFGLFDTELKLPGIFDAEMSKSGLLDQEALGSSHIPGNQDAVVEFVVTATVTASALATFAAFEDLVGAGYLHGPVVPDSFSVDFSDDFGDALPLIAGEKILQGAVSFVGVGLYTASGLATYAGVANYTGVATLTVNGLATQTGQLAFTGIGLVAAAGEKVLSTTVSYTGIGISTFAGLL